MEPSRIGLACLPSEQAGDRSQPEHARGHHERRAVGNRDEGTNRHGARHRTYIAGHLIDTGVKYMDKWEPIDATRGSEQHAKAIVEEMKDFRRRERAARLSAAGPP